MRKHILSLFGLVTIALVATAFIGTGSRAASHPDGTLTPRAYLPFVAYQPTPVPEGFIPPDNRASERAIADLINQKRAEHNLPPLTLVPELTQAARGHSQDMAVHDFQSHIGWDGSRYWERINEAGYDCDWDTCSEVIGWHTLNDPEAMVDWWLGSPGHRAIVLSSDYDECGVGYVHDEGDALGWGHYWTVDLGERQ